MKKALLLSGGMDSICLAYWRRPDLSITIDYGQKSAKGEIRAAAIVCKTLNIPHKIICCNLSDLGSGDLVGQKANCLAPSREWFPYRNQMLVTLSAMECIKSDIRTIEIGCLKSDRFHKDGCPQFISILNELLSMQEGRINLHAPACEYTASELVRESHIPLGILAWSHSCHISDRACGYCRGCQKHYETMESLGYPPH